MTQAFNLSQLANKVNSSGQLDATTGLSGATPIANGGTGTSTTPSLIAGSGITISGAWPNQTVTGSGGVSSLNGQTGAIDNTTQYAIGSYVLGRPANATVYDNSTIAGSSLYASGSHAGYYATSGESLGWAGSLATATAITVGAISYVNTGSWRCVSIAGHFGNDASTGNSGLWVRYA